MIIFFHAGFFFYFEFYRGQYDIQKKKASSIAWKYLQSNDQWKYCDPLQNEQYQCLYQNLLKSNKNSIIENFQRESQSYQILIDSKLKYAYQLNVHTQEKKSLKRQQWQVQQDRQNKQSIYPKDWVNLQKQQFKKVQTFKLKQKSSKFIDISKHFLSTSSSNLKVLSIQRIQCKRLYQNYINKKNTEERSGHSINELLLFHGTLQKNPIQILQSDQGLDIRSSIGGFYGNGIYFSYNSSVCDKNYSYVNRKRQKQILYCKVLVGQSYDYKNTTDNRLTRPPKFNNGKSYYDSVKGTISNDQIYVIYSNSKCYPEYLITYIQQ